MDQLSCSRARDNVRSTDIVLSLQFCGFSVFFCGAPTKCSFTGTNVDDGVHCTLSPKRNFRKQNETLLLLNYYLIEIT